MKVGIGILKYLVIILSGMFSISVMMVVYINLKRIGKITNASRMVFIQRSRNEVQELGNNSDSNVFDKVINKLMKGLGSFFDVTKVEKDITRAKIKDFKNIGSMVVYGLFYSVALFSTILAVRLIIFDMGAMKIANFVAIPIGMYLPWAQVWSIIKKQDIQIRIEIPEVLDLIRQGVAAGLLFDDAIKEARPKNGGSVDYLLKEVIGEIATSGNHVKAIYDMAEKINDEKIREFLQQLVVAYDADSERQLEICANLATNVRELEAVSKDLQIDRIDEFLKLWQYTCVGVVGLVFLAFVLYDTLTKFS